MKIIELYPDGDIKRGRYRVDFYANGERILTIETVEFSLKPELGENDTWVEDPYFQAVIRQKNSYWQVFLGMRIIRPKIIERVIEIINEMAESKGIYYCLKSDKRPGDEPPFKERRENGNSTGKI